MLQRELFSWLRRNWRRLPQCAEPLQRLKGSSEAGVRRSVLGVLTSSHDVLLNKAPL